MRFAATLALGLAILSAGCLASGGGADPWAYTKKPLYAGGFDLSKLGGESTTQQFRVTDGSIGAIRVQVWINATQGGATVVVRDPSGNALLTTSETTERQFHLDLGTWTVTVEPRAPSAGIVHVLATRA